MNASPRRRPPPDLHAPISGDAASRRGDRADVKGNAKLQLTRREKKTPHTKQITNHFSLVLKLRDEASRTFRRKGDQNAFLSCRGPVGFLVLNRGRVSLQPERGIGFPPRVVGHVSRAGAHGCRGKRATTRDSHGPEEPRALPGVTAGVTAARCSGSKRPSVCGPDADQGTRHMTRALKHSVLQETSGLRTEDADTGLQGSARLPVSLSHTAGS